MKYKNNSMAKDLNLICFCYHSLRYPLIIPTKAKLACLTRIMFQPAAYENSKRDRDLGITSSVFSCLDYEERLMVYVPFVGGHLVSIVSFSIQNMLCEIFGVFWDVGFVL